MHDLTPDNKLTVFGRRLLELVRRERAIAVLALALSICLLADVFVAAAKAAAPAVQSALTVEQAAPLAVSAEARIPAELPEDEAAAPVGSIVKPAMTRLRTPSIYKLPRVRQGAAAGSGVAFGSDYTAAAASYSGSAPWVQIPGTYVNGPVAQGNDNAFYLTHSYNGAYNVNGSIYAHYRNNIRSINSLDQNTVLFGHNKSVNRYGSNMTNLGSILRFQDAGYAAGNRFIYLTLGGQTATFVIFAALDAEVRGDAQTFYYWSTSIGNDILYQAMDRSYWDYGVDVNTGDRILTLSTCSYDWGYDAHYNTYAKFVVMARMLRPGETTGSFGGIRANTDRRTPAGLSRWGA